MIANIVFGLHRKIFLADEDLWLYTPVFVKYTKLTILAFFVQLLTGINWKWLPMELILL